MRDQLHYQVVEYNKQKKYELAQEHGYVSVVCDHKIEARICLNSPKTMKALRMLGIHPDEMTPKQVNEDDNNRTKEIINIKQKHYEKFFIASVNKIIEKRSEIMEGTVKTNLNNLSVSDVSLASNHSNMSFLFPKLNSKLTKSVNFLSQDSLDLFQTAVKQINSSGTQLQNLDDTIVDDHQDLMFKLQLKQQMQKFNQEKFQKQKQAVTYYLDEKQRKEKLNQYHQRLQQLDRQIKKNLDEIEKETKQNCEYRQNILKTHQRSERQNLRERYKEQTQFYEKGNQKLEQELEMKRQKMEELRKQEEQKHYISIQNIKKQTQTDEQIRVELNQSIELKQNSYETSSIDFIKTRLNYRKSHVRYQQKNQLIYYKNSINQIESNQDRNYKQNLNIKLQALRQQILDKIQVIEKGKENFMSNNMRISQKLIQQESSKDEHLLVMQTLNQKKNLEKKELNEQRHKAAIDKNKKIKKEIREKIKQNRQLEKVDEVIEKHHQYLENKKDVQRETNHVKEQIILNHKQREQRIADMKYEEFQMNQQREMQIKHSLNIQKYLLEKAQSEAALQLHLMKQKVDITVDQVNALIEFEKPPKKIKKVQQILKEVKEGDEPDTQAPLVKKNKQINYPVRELKKVVSQDILSSYIKAN